MVEGDKKDVKEGEQKEEDEKIKEKIEDDGEKVEIK